MPDPSSTADARPDAQWARLFADLAHEVRAVAGGAAMSLDAFRIARSDDERARMAGLLESANRRMVRLAEDLRDVADTLSGPGPRPRVEHDVVLAARRVASELAPEASLRNLELTLEGDLPAHVIVCDPAAWDRALRRLYLASLESARRGERVTVTFEPRSPGLDLFLPYAGPELPPDGALCASWTEARDGGAELFPRGLWLARAFLVAEGGGLAVRGEGGERRLVASLPAARPG
jgi:hypothetical protein